MLAQETTQLVTPPLMKLKNKIQINPPIIKEEIAEMRAPARKLFTKVPLLNAILKPIIGQRRSEHMKYISPIRSGEEPLSRIPVDTRRKIMIEGDMGNIKPIKKLRSLLISFSKLSL